MKEDFFDSDLEPEDTVLPKMGPTEDLDTKATASPPLEAPRKRQIMGYDLSTVLTASAALIALTIYAVWPDSPPPQAFIPDNTVQPAPIDNPEPSAAPAMAEVTDTEFPLPAPIMAPAVTEKETDEIRQYGAANREAIMALNERVTSLSKQLQSLNEQLLAQQQRATLVSAATATRTAKPATTKHQIKSTGQTVTRSAGGVKGWRVHTLYPGMAWIAHNGSTWSVRPGDVLQGLTIRTIDTDRRVVVTDKGTIRLSED